jgi:hypothetical protein
VEDVGVDIGEGVADRVSPVFHPPRRELVAPGATGFNNESEAGFRTGRV